MKKVISVILNVLSITAAVVLLIFAAFCAYDWISLANSAYAYTIEFWLVMDYYAVAMLIISGVGAVFAIPNYFIAESKKIKTMAKNSSIAFAAMLVASAVLYILPLDF